MCNILWCHHIFALKIKIMQNMSQVTCQGKDTTLGHSIKHPSKRNMHTVVILLHRELYLNLNRHIQHGRALTNTGLWSSIHKIPTGVRQKAECPGQPGSFENRMGNKNSCFETCRISHIGHILGRFKPACSALASCPQIPVCYPHPDVFDRAL